MSAQKHTGRESLFSSNKQLRSHGDPGRGLGFVWISRKMTNRRRSLPWPSNMGTAMGIGRGGGGTFSGRDAVFSSMNNWSASAAVPLRPAACSPQTSEGSPLPGSVNPADQDAGVPGMHSVSMRSRLPFVHHGTLPACLFPRPFRCMGSGETKGH